MKNKPGLVNWVGCFYICALEKPGVNLVEVAGHDFITF